MDKNYGTVGPARPRTQAREPSNLCLDRLVCRAGACALVRSSPSCDGWWAVLEHGATHVSIQHAVNSTGFTMWLNTSLCAPSVINPMHQDPQMKEQEQTLERNRHSERAKYHQGPNQAMPCSAPPPGRLVL